MRSLRVINRVSSGFFNGLPITGATEPEILAVEAGACSVRVTVKSCSSTSQAMLVMAVQEPTPARPALSLYLNPVQKKCQVLYSLLYPVAQCSLSLFTLTGLEVGSYPLEKIDPISWQTYLSIGHLPKCLSEKQGINAEKYKVYP